MVAALLLAPPSAAAQECAERLAQCESELLYEHVAAVEAQTLLERATRDTDRDLRRDLDDRCPDTAPALAVDLAGCSLAQFCSSFPAGTSRERQACRRLDWRNDEPEKARPRDCEAPDRASGGAVCRAAAAEPAAELCALDLTVDVTFDAGWDPLGVTVFVDYPTTVTVPGSSGDPALATRVENLTGLDGVLAVGDSDLDADGLDDRLGVLFHTVLLGAPIPSGPLVRIHFDCTGSVAPTAADFAWVSDAADGLGRSVPSSCTVVAAPRQPR